MRPRPRPAWAAGHGAASKHSRALSIRRGLPDRGRDEQQRGAGMARGDAAKVAGIGQHQVVGRQRRVGPAALRPVPLAPRPVPRPGRRRRLPARLAAPGTGPARSPAPAATGSCCGWRSPGRRARGRSGLSSIWTGRFKSATILRTSASCCASFSPKTATSGLTRLNSLSTTVSTPSKNPGLKAPSRMSPIEPGRTVTICSCRVHLLVAWSEDDADALVSADGHVGPERARVTVQVFAGSELQRVDEHGNHDRSVPARDLASTPEQSPVPVVQRAHGRYQDHRRTAGSRGPRRGRSSSWPGSGSRGRP